MKNLKKGFQALIWPDKIVLQLIEEKINDLSNEMRAISRISFPENDIDISKRIIHKIAPIMNNGGLLKEIEELEKINLIGSLNAIIAKLKITQEALTSLVIKATKTLEAEHS